MLQSVKLVWQSITGAQLNLCVGMMESGNEDLLMKSGIKIKYIFKELANKVSNRKSGEKSTR